MAESDFIDHWPSTSEFVNKDINITKIESLDEEKFNKLQYMLNQHKIAFAQSFDDLKKACSIQKQVINIVPVNIPIRSLPYRKSIEENDLNDNDIEQILKNIMCPSSSPWAPPKIVTPKNDST